MKLDRRVFIRESREYAYGTHPPYYPDRTYPEILRVFGNDKDNNNSVYGAVRSLFLDAGFNTSHIGYDSWNPLGDFIKPGMKVVIKPNFVRHYGDLEPDPTCLITHGSVIRVVTDYVFLALKDKGSIVIVDAPQDDADFEILAAKTGLKELKEYYAQEFGFNLEYYDLRQYETRKMKGVVIEKRTLPGDPHGYKIVDLGDHSLLSEMGERSSSFYGADYDVEELRTHHRHGKHEYCIARTILEADVIINLPKMKTHKKVGVTLSMKNLVGINGDKNYLPHYTLGPPITGGDQFSDNSFISLLEHYLLRYYKIFFKGRLKLSQNIGVPMKLAGERVFGGTDTRKIRSGNWHGNDTIWRTVLDLNRILLFCDKDGLMKNEPQRGYLSIVDGVIAGEGNGPLGCRSKSTGILVQCNNNILTIVDSYDIIHVCGNHPSHWL